MKQQLLQKLFFVFLIATVLCLTSAEKSNGQWVHIPDANFRNAIASLVPAAISGDSLDVSNAQIQNMQDLDITGQNISNIQGIEYFTGLKTLDCKSNKIGPFMALLPSSLTSLNCFNNPLIALDYFPLPASLTKLWCGYTSISYLPTLPSSLTDLDCSGNALTSLPALPSSLLNLGCIYTQLTSLPTLPSSLTSINCSQNPLTSLPTLPASLKDLICTQTSLASLPVLPASLTSLDCSQNSLTALPSLPSSLTSLNCSVDSLTSLPALPLSLISLSCGSNLLTALPTLSPSLMNIICDGNSLTSLPTLPSSLHSLSCANNKLTSLPALPSSITFLYCYQNALSALPTLPSALYDLFCYQNPLSTLPSLPSSLHDLRCYNDSLTSLPALPSSLDNLNCNDNLLTSLPNLSSLHSLNCNHNLLTSLPDLPSSFSILDCSNNLLTSLPPLQSMYQLICSDNFISCLPLLPEGIQYLTGTNAGYTCLPNKPVSLTHIQGPDSLCDQYNSPCSLYPHITGTAFNDDNLDLVQNNGEIGHPNLNIHIQPGNYFFSTGDTGYYSYIVDTGNTYTITPSSIPYYTIVPNSHSTPLLSFGLNDTLNDFALQPTGIVHDLNVKATAINNARRGFNITHVVTIKNNGTVTDTAFLKYVFDSLITYLSSTPPADVVSGDSLQWNNIRLVPGQEANFHVVLYIDTGVPLNTNLISYSVINPVAKDSTPADNTDTIKQVVRGSYDPNDKTVSPSGAIPVAQISEGQWLDYTIRFQNTGNDTALNVEVRDTLSGKLDLNTMQIISSSHPMTWSIRKHVAYFEFNNIDLPDSNINESLSHGFVRYRIKADTNLSAGDIIKNTAYIYFDNNSPVVTNTATNTICEPNGQTLSANICKGEPYDFNGQIVDSTGTYYSTKTNIAGCDSVITLQLAVNHVDTSVVINQDTLTALATNATYQWFSCKTGIPENGAADYFFIPSDKDEYAVIVNQNNCMDTSACYSVLLTGVAGARNNPGKMFYPNPAHDEITICSSGKFTISNLLGETMSEGILKQDKNTILTIKNLPSGVYFVQVVNEKGGWINKLVKE